MPRIVYRLPVSGDRHIPFMRARAVSVRELRGSLWEAAAKPRKEES